MMNDIWLAAADDVVLHFVSCRPHAEVTIRQSDRDRNRWCKKKLKDHVEFLCELYEAQAACGRCFVHELMSEVNSRMRCVAKIMTMPGNQSSDGGSVYVLVGRV